MHRGPCSYRLRRSPCLTAAKRFPSVALHSNSRPFDFANVEKESGRRHRAADKREAERAMGLVRNLCSLTQKQLAVLTKHMMEQHHKELMLARSLSPLNQGRQRQERLLAKILQRDLDSEGLAQLQALVRAAGASAGELSLDPEQEAHVAYWRTGLLVGDKEVEAELLGVASQAGGSTSMQQMRQLLRQCREAQDKVASERQKAGMSDSPRDSLFDEDDGGADVASLLASKLPPSVLAAQKEYKRKRSKLNKLLKELVKHVGQAQAGRVAA